MVLPSSKRPLRASSYLSLNPSNLANHHSDNLAGDISTTTLLLSETVKALDGAFTMRAVSSVVLLLNEPNAPDGLLRIKPLERQDRGDQQTCLWDGQCGSPLFSRFCTRTRK